MKLLPVLCVALLVAGCATRPHAATPQLAGIIRQAGDITSTIRLAQSDGKEVKSLHRQSMSLVERLDYKTQVLLERK
jgi:hypothetical protein